MTRMTNERWSDLSRSTNQQAGEKQRLNGRERASTELGGQKKSAKGRKQTRDIVSYTCICEQTNAHTRKENDYSNSETYHHKTNSTITCIVCHHMGDSQSSECHHNCYFQISPIISSECVTNNTPYIAFKFPI